MTSAFSWCLINQRLSSWTVSCFLSSRLSSRSSSVSILNGASMPIWIFLNHLELIWRSVCFKWTKIKNRITVADTRAPHPRHHPNLPQNPRHHARNGGHWQYSALIGEMVARGSDLSVIRDGRGDLKWHVVSHHHDHLARWMGCPLATITVNLWILKYLKIFKIP